MRLFARLMNLVIVLPLTAIAAAGGPIPDPHWGAEGLLLVPFNIGGDRGDQANAMALQPDGKLLVAGSVGIYAPESQNTNHDWALVRLLPDGGLDPGFDGDGKLLLDVVSDFGYAEIRDIALQPDGKIILFGEVRANSMAGDVDLMFARLHGNGSLDTSFDFDGYRVFDLADSEIAERVLVQPDGKIVGTGGRDTGTDVCATTIRLNPDGSNDTGFGSGGIACPTSDGSLPYFIAADIARMADGKLVLAGVGTHAGQTQINGDMLAVRLHANGTLDAGFGAGGQAAVVFDQGSDFYDAALAITFDAMGRIVLAGSVSAVQGSDMAVARLLANGSPDLGFGSGGRALMPFDYGGYDGDAASAVAVLPDGRFLLGGTATYPAGVFPPLAGAAGMLTANGAPDERFGDGGRWVQRHPGDPTWDWSAFHDMIVDGDFVYLAGYMDTPNPPPGLPHDRDFAIVRLILPLFRDGFEGESR